MELDVLKKRTKEIKALTEEEVKKSKWFKQTAYTKLELCLHPLITTIVSIFVYKYEMAIATDYFDFHGDLSGRSWFVRNSGTLLFLFALIQVVKLKNCFYILVGLIYDLQPLSNQDEFWLYDYAINPINVPIFAVSKKGSMTSEEIKNLILNRLGRGFNHRCAVKHVKILGKYFFQKLSEEEYKQWSVSRVQIVPEIRTIQEMIQFGLKYKRVEGKDLENCSVYGFGFPNLEGGLIGMMATGHHTAHDGISLMQSLYSISDGFTEDPKDYPFFPRETVPWWAWIIFTLL